jgi:hypothetical protein
MTTPLRHWLVEIAVLAAILLAAAGWVATPAQADWAEEYAAEVVMPAEPPIPAEPSMPAESVMPAEPAVPAGPVMPAQPPMPAEQPVPLVPSEAMDADPGPAAPDPPAVAEPPKSDEMPAPEVPEVTERSESATQAAAQNINVDIRILSPGNDGPVSQEVFAPQQGFAPDSSGAEAPSADPLGSDWTWNWTWTETCGDGAARTADWNWNWEWCGDLNIPDVFGSGAADLPDLDTLLDAGDQKPAGDAPSSVPSPGPPERRTRGGRDASDHDDADVAAVRTSNSFERIGPVGPMPAHAPAHAVSPREAPRKSSAELPDSPEPIVPQAAATATGPPSGAAGGLGAIALLAALFLLGPSLLRGYLRHRAPLRTSHPSSRLERPG